jgi:hypothetical protein
MFRTLHKIFFILILPSFALAQVPNASFETWTTGLPDSWTANVNPPSLVPVTQSSDAHSGTSAAKGTVVDYMGSPVPPNLYPLSTSGLGFTIHSRYAYFTFWYKSDLLATDVVTVNVVIYHSSGISIGYAYSYLVTNSAYSMIYLPINYTTQGNAAYAQVTFSMADTAAQGFHLGSYFLIDDMGFSTVNEVEDLSASSFNVFPNPVKDKLSVSDVFSSSEPYKMQLINCAGETVMTSTVENTSSEFPPIDVAKYAEGSYILTISDSKKSTSKRFLICKE